MCAFLNYPSIQQLAHSAKALSPREPVPVNKFSFGSAWLAGRSKQSIIGKLTGTILAGILTPRFLASWGEPRTPLAGAEEKKKWWRVFGVRFWWLDVG